MSDLKIGDRVTGIKGNTRVTGTVMNIKEGHVHIKAPVSGVYAPLVSIVPLHKVTKLGEGAMKRKAEAEDDAGMSDYMHHVQTSSAPFDGAKPAKPHQDQFGNKIKIGNVAKNLAKQGMRGIKKEEVEQIDEVGDTPKGRAALASYITKAAPKIRSNTHLKGHFEGEKYRHLKTVRKHSPNVNPNRKHERDPEKKEYAERLAKSAGDLSDKFALRAKNRITGIQRAADKLAKEEVESIDEVNARHSLEAAQAALTPRAKNVKAALSNTARDKAATNKYARRISKISPDYKPKDVKDNLRSMGEDLHSRKVYEPTSAQELNPGLRARIDADSNAQKPAPAGSRPIGKIKLMTRKEEVEQVEEGYKGRRAFGSAYDKTHDPFQDSKSRFKSRELEHELAHEAPSGPAHHDQTPHDVHIDGKKWKTFGSAGHAHNVANKLSISGKRASVHKTPIAEAAPKDFDEYSRQEKEKDTARKVLRYGGTGIGRALLHGATSAFVGKKNATRIANKFGNRAQQDDAVRTVNKYNMKIKESNMSVDEKAPPGWEGTVKAMKKHSEIDNPYALAWWMKRKGAKSHKDEK